MSSDYLELRNKAIQQYDAAFHLLNVTFPLIKDPKLMTGIINNIFSSLEYTMEAILAYERQLQLVPHYLDNFQSKFNLFRYKSVKRNKIPLNLILLIMDMKELVELHQKCPMKFQRGNRYVLASHDYELKVLSISEIREYIAQNKEFLRIMDTILKIS